MNDDRTTPRAAISTVLLPATLLFALPVAAEPSRTKEAAVAAVSEHGEELVDLAQHVWRFAETALQEERSAALLADYAEKQGFRVERGIAGMPTAFLAEYGSGEPVIAILGEYDALPGISQQAVTEQIPLEEGAGGHGCGHNLFGAASLGAALAVKELIEAGSLRGTLRFYGTPAEEAVGGKLYMIRDGLFRDVDVAIAWHPGDEIQADTGSTQAMVDLVVEFRGRTAHAAADPWNGRSAVDALEIFTFALNQMREHVRPTVRMHYTILEGGQVPNVVPDRAKLWVWLRDSKHERVDELLERARDIAKGAAVAAGVQSELKVQGGSYEMLPLFAGARAIHANLERLGPIPFTEEEQEFAKAIQRATGTEEKGLRATLEPFDENPGEPEGGSTDVADVSWIVPTLHFTVTTAAADAPWHAWPVVATGGMSIGHKGMLHAAKALAATVVDLYEQPALVESIRKEFAEKTAGKTFRGYLAPGPPPLPGR
ncbi:MAG TPA: amidohydrolase [Thermoanaerobaculia bacterium]|nr:amidohydrolase [Thermoanaerobaculia bacterium]